MGFYFCHWIGIYGQGIISFPTPKCCGDFELADCSNGCLRASCYNNAIGPHACPFFCEPICICKGDLVYNDCTNECVWPNKCPPLYVLKKCVANNAGGPVNQDECEHGSGSGSSAESSASSSSSASSDASSSWNSGENWRLLEGVGVFREHRKIWRILKEFGRLEEIWWNLDDFWYFWRNLENFRGIWRILQEFERFWRFLKYFEVLCNSDTKTILVHRILIPYTELPECSNKIKVKPKQCCSILNFIHLVS